MATAITHRDDVLYVQEPPFSAPLAQYLQYTPHACSFLNHRRCEANPLRGGSTHFRQMKENVLMDDLDARFERCGSIVGRIIDGEVFLLDEKRNRLHPLNSVGTFVWGLLEGPYTLREVARRVADKFAVSEEVAQADTRELLEKLAAKGIVRAMDGAAKRR